MAKYKEAIHELVQSICNHRNTEVEHTVFIPRFGFMDICTGVQLDICTCKLCGKKITKESVYLNHTTDCEEIEYQEV